MTNKLFKELLNNQPLKVEQIKTWLVENENYVNFLINESKCGKWSKWVNKSIRALPCCCPIREEGCIFIETYYELLKAFQWYQKDDSFKFFVQDYKEIEGNKEAELDWYYKHKDIDSKLLFNQVISIYLESEPYKTMKIQLDKNEFENIIEFRKIISKINLEEEMRLNC